jgi:hypothetical protein
MGDPPKGNEALVVSLLISIINARARKLKLKADS